jgi:hypothetical protein
MGKRVTLRALHNSNILSIEFPRGLYSWRLEVLKYDFHVTGLRQENELDQNIEFHAKFCEYSSCIFRKDASGQTESACLCRINCIHFRK